ncbi:undecaprenyl-diphosphate phosphatase [Blochmannia endosymbiont of Colobopsis nipponica]|uniref:undecaprenyl-diphosphate phosphatase n=1 Tax=Blochmannia endosymbiont of Colobopsis nipponica TaxID=2681987 RepID=UPI001785180D|nr:undecaprenyl-diphosphate phosphatase [Blochmannia endosymbiont of Colobopsis nipponica]QOI10788.1 undecaprenyl-diphosphate phosphatase [Blochmannia endosymbiont of Colobopsis nipponica]
MNYHELLVIFILGVVEGITEFLPVSSSGHMMLIGYLLEFNNERAKIFEVFIQFGTIFSVIIKFWEKIPKKLGIFSQKSVLMDRDDGFPFLWLLFFGMLPIVVLGFLFYEQIKFFFELKYVMRALVLGGLLLLIAEYFAYNPPFITSINKLSYLQAFFIGCFQCFALFPGFSRAGATISGGLLIGLNRYASFEFSFFLAVPVIFGAATLDLCKNLSFFTLQDSLLFLVGFITSFVVGLSSIRYFLQFIEKITFIPFVVYRFVLASVIYFLCCD